jgi:hypothetical protein
VVSLLSIVFFGLHLCCHLSRRRKEVKLAERLKHFVSAVSQILPTSLPVAAMASHANDAEEQRFQEEVKELKQWWTDSRWRFTRRPYTAEQIANKRGNIKVEYPSNVLAKKLWKTVEERFAV